MKLLEKQAKAEHVEQLVEKQCETRRHDEKRRESWRKYYKNQHEYIECEAGGIKRYIVLDKPHIENEFWYDDEYESPLTDDPKQRHSYFIAENLRRFRDFNISEWHECEDALASGRACTGRHISKPFLCVYPSGETYPVFMSSYDNLNWMDSAGAERFELSKEEIEQLEAIMEGQKAKFEKRLETYWKRYSDKVCAHGYLANR